MAFLSVQTKARSKNMLIKRNTCIFVLENNMFAQYILPVAYHNARLMYFKKRNGFVFIY